MIIKIKPGVPAPGMRDRMGPTFDERRGVEYRQLRAASLVNRLNARPMPFGWTVNPYRGCEMSCKYCFARYTHEFLGENDPAAFERRIYVKLTDPGSLVAELKRARRSGLLVALGTATDPYQPAETRFEVTRRVLEAAAKVVGVRLSITTKSTFVRRDLALLRELAAGSEVSVNFSIPTLDQALARRLEPRAPRPDLRFEAMTALAAGGIPTRLFIMPVLPRLTDGEANLRALLVRAREAGAEIAESNVLFCDAGRERRSSSSSGRNSRSSSPSTSGSTPTRRMPGATTSPASKRSCGDSPPKSDSPRVAAPTARPIARPRVNCLSYGESDPTVGPGTPGQPVGETRSLRVVCGRPGPGSSPGLARGIHPLCVTATCDRWGVSGWSGVAPPDVNQKRLSWGSGSSTYGRSPSNSVNGRKRSQISRTLAW